MGLLNTSGVFGTPEGAFRNLSSESPKQVDPSNPLVQLISEPSNDETIQQMSSYLGINLIAGVPQVLKNASYTLVLEDANKHLYKSNTSAYTWTIPANSAVAFEIGTCITFINGGSAGNITIAITTDTLRLVPTGGTASKTLAAYGMATAIKVAATTWLINGTGIS